jgi:hypothetical protein
LKFLAEPYSYEDALAAVERLQAIMIARGEAQLGKEEDDEYRAIRRALMREPEFRSRLPRLLTGNSDLGGVWSNLRDHSGQWEGRRMFVREQMTDALNCAMELAASDAVLPSSQWTGIQSKRERLMVARRLLPLVQASVEGLIAELERPQGNGGPPLEYREEALQNLKALHEVLGRSIADLESGRGSISDKLMGEAAGYIARAARSLRDDPMPYLVSGGVAAMLGLLGAGEIGAYLAGIAQNIRKNAGTS